MIDSDERAEAAREGKNFDGVGVRRSFHEFISLPRLPFDAKHGYIGVPPNPLFRAKL